jgi:sugar phosphate isomerase/epimerase
MKKIVFVILFIMTAMLNIQSKNPSGKAIYLQLYSLRDDIKADFGSTLDKVAEMGYTGIEAAGYKDGKFYGLAPEVFKTEIEKRGMKVLSSHVGKSLHDDVGKTNWDDIWTWWDSTIAAHKTAGMKYIVIPSMPLVKTLSDLKVYCDYYNRIGEKCKTAGIRFGYHNHSFEFAKIENEIMYDYMLKNTDANNVFFQMDVYWVVRGGCSPVDYFKKYPGRFEILHLKDNKELGESGMVGFDAIFGNSKVAGTNYFIVEVEKYNFTPIESVRKSLLYLQNNSFFN